MTKYSWLQDNRYSCLNLCSCWRPASGHTVRDLSETNQRPHEIHTTGNHEETAELVLGSSCLFGCIVKVKVHLDRRNGQEALKGWSAVKDNKGGTLS